MRCGDAGALESVVGAGAGEPLKFIVEMPPRSCDFRALARVYPFCPANPRARSVGLALAMVPLNPAFYRSVVWAQTDSRRADAVFVSR